MKLSIITEVTRGYNHFQQASLRKSISDVYLVSPPAWASLRPRGFPQSPSATRPCWGRWHASSAPMSHRRSSHRASGSHPAPSCPAHTDTESEGKIGQELEQNSQNTQIEQIWSTTSTCKASKMDFQTSFFQPREITSSGNNLRSTFILRVVEGQMNNYICASIQRESL